jgi:hypothetical protein
MRAASKFARSAFALSFAAGGLAPTGASAITLEIAKKCNALVAKEFPPRQIGNPASGSTKGSAKSEHDYFNKCVANGGNMDGDTDKNPK